MINTFAAERQEISSLLRELLEGLPKTLTSSVEEGTRKALVSSTVLDALHDHFAKRTRSKLAEWVFDRLTTVVASLVLAASLTWYALFRGNQ